MYTKENFSTNNLIAGVEFAIEKVEFNIYLNTQAPTYSELTYSDEEMFDYVAQDVLRETIRELLSTLTPREEKVLRLRFGLNDGYERDLEEVANEFGITRERLRQIEAKALRKLRHPSRSNKLKDFLK